MINNQITTFSNTYSAFKQFHLFIMNVYSVTNNFLSPPPNPRTLVTFKNSHIKKIVGVSLSIKCAPILIHGLG